MSEQSLTTPQETPFLARRPPRMCSRARLGGAVVSTPLHSRAVLAAPIVTTERNHGVLNYRFGIFDNVPHTLSETAKVFKISRERVRQIVFREIRKLRHPSRGTRNTAIKPELFPNWSMTIRLYNALYNAGYREEMDVKRDVLSGKLHWHRSDLRNLGKKSYGELCILLKIEPFVSRRRPKEQTISTYIRTLERLGYRVTPP